MARRRLRFNRNSEADVDMTPMLDIVFILLIFFIVTAVFLDEEGLDFTKTEGLEPLTPVAAISITLDHKNQVSVEGRIVPLSFVEAEVQVHLAEKPNAVISFLAHDRARLDEVIQIKDEMERAGHEVSFDTYAETQRAARLE